MTSEIRINTLKNRVGLGTISLSSTGPIVSGIVTANSFVGSLPISSDSNNRVITATGSGGLNGEANLTFDGSKLTLAANSTAYDAFQVGDGLFIGNTTNNISAAIFHQGGGANLEIGSQNQITFTTGSTAGNANERLRIDSSGRLLIGTTTEGHGNADDLTIATTDHTGITLRSATNRNGSVFFSDGTSGADEYRGWIQYTHTSDYLTFGTGGTERVRIDSSGRVGLGIDNPGDYFASYNRVVMGRPNDAGSMTIVSAPTYGGYIAFADGTSGNQAYRGLISYYHGQDAMVFGTDGGTERIRIASNGKVGIGLTNPAHNLDVYLTGRFNQLGQGGHGLLVGPGTNTGGFTYMSTGDMEISCAMTTKDIVFSDAVGGNQRMRLTGDTGRLGIGTNSPDTLLEIYNSSTSGNTALKIHNDKTGDAAQIILEGGRTSFTDCAQLIFANRGNLVSGIVANSAADDGELSFRTSASGSGSSIVERLRIKSDGTIKIGNTSGFTSTSIRLQVHNPSSTSSQMQFTGTGTGANSVSRGFRVGYNGDGGQLWNFENNYVRFATNNTERLRIDSNGDINLGNNPTNQYGYKLNIQDSAIIYAQTASSGGLEAKWHLDNSAQLMEFGTVTTDDLALVTNNTERIRIASNGKVGINIRGGDNTSPVRNLDIAESSGAVLRLISTDDSLGANERLGEIEFYSDDDDNAHIGAFIKAIADPSDVAGRRTALLFGTQNHDASVNAVEKVRIDCNGNVVIGHTSTNNKFQIGNTGHSGYAIATNSASYGAVIQVGDGATPGAAAALWVRNLNNGGGATALLRVQGDGTTHFGNQTSTAKYNDGNTGTSWYDIKDSWQQGQSASIGWSCYYMNKIGSGDNRYFQFTSSGSVIGYINRNGSNTQFATSSDYRLKKDVVALPNGIERVKKLRPVAFKWIEDNSNMEGFLAHEAQEVCPYAVTGSKDEVALEDHGDRKKGDMIVQSVDYGEFTPLLTAAMKELIAKVESLEAEISALKGS